VSTIDLIRTLLIPVFVGVLMLSEWDWKRLLNSDDAPCSSGPLFRPRYLVVFLLLTAAALWLGWHQRSAGPLWLSITGIIVAPCLAWWFIWNENHAALKSLTVTWRRRDSYKRPVSILLLVAILAINAIPVAIHRFASTPATIP
jgi:hypothetical protein